MRAPTSTNGSKVSNPVPTKKTKGMNIPTVATIRPTGPNVVSLLAHRDGFGSGAPGGNDAVGATPNRPGACEEAEGPPTLGSGAKKS